MKDTLAVALARYTDFAETIDLLAHLERESPMLMELLETGSVSVTVDGERMVLCLGLMREG